MDIRQRLGRNVRRLREGNGWSQEDYADRAGIHRTYVSDIERGKRNPTVTVVEKLAKRLELPPGSLLGGQPAAADTQAARNMRKRRPSPTLRS